MSLSFLAKKTWHTQRTDNVEQVWLAEQKKEKEEKKLKELQKQIDEERQVRSRRPAVLRRLHAIDARRLQERRSWVVSFSILRPFGPSRATATPRAG